MCYQICLLSIFSAGYNIYVGHSTTIFCVYLVFPCDQSDYHALSFLGFNAHRLAYFAIYQVVSRFSCSYEISVSITLRLSQDPAHFYRGRVERGITPNHRRVFIFFSSLIFIQRYFYYRF